MWSREVHGYLNGSFKAIDGWCLPHLWQIIQPLKDALDAEGVSAPVAEIGIYHGKFFIGLLKTMNAPAKNYAIDLFDLQRFNLDGSGSGNRVQFESNLELSGIATGAVVFVTADSLTLTPSWVEMVRNDTKGFSFFSVDGGHTVEHTTSDLEIAMLLTRPEGIIFVDDYYNASWPGVQEGVARLFFSSTPKFVPLLFSCNKLFLCHLSRHRQYLEIVRKYVTSTFADTRVKEVRRYGYAGLTIQPNFNSHEFLRIAADQSI